jgi:hypothetical protein
MEYLESIINDPFTRKDGEGDEEEEEEEKEEEKADAAEDTTEDVEKVTKLLAGATLKEKEK